MNLIIITTTSPSNLRPTTRECMHLVTRGHYRSRDKDAFHTIRSAIIESSLLQANIIALCFIEPVNRIYCRWKFYIAE